MITLTITVIIEVIHSFIHSSMTLPPFVGPWPLLQFCNIFTQSVGHLGWGISPSQGRYLHAGQHKHRINAQQESMPWMGFEYTIPVFEAKTVQALDRAATMICIIHVIFYWISEVQHGNFTDIRSDASYAIVFIIWSQHVHVWRPSSRITE
jgi:hypothetical protein